MDDQRAMPIDERILKTLRTMHQDIMDLQQIVVKFYADWQIATGEDPYGEGAEEMAKEARETVEIYGQMQPRRLVDVSAGDGTVTQIALDSLDDRIQTAVRLSIQYGEPYQLYLGTDGTVRIQVSNEIVARMHAFETPQDEI